MNAPKEQAPRKPHPPADWPERFLRAYRQNGNISQSARAAKVGRNAVYEHADADPDFAQAMEQAKEEALDYLEQEAHRRAVVGVLKPVYQGGKKVGQVREYSDGLLTLLLKANRPKKFRDQFEVMGKGGGPIQSVMAAFDPAQKSDQELRAILDRLTHLQETDLQAAGLQETDLQDNGDSQDNDDPNSRNSRASGISDGSEGASDGSEGAAETDD